MLDIVSGLLLMLVTLALLGGMMVRSRAAGKRLADDRAAVRLAESTLLRLGAHADAVPAEGVEVRHLDAAAPEGFRWATATATVAGRRASLTGLVRTASATTREATP
jgi:hypothetical protein